MQILVLQKLPHPYLLDTISSPCWIQWLLEPQTVTNVPSQIDVSARILTSEFGQVANKGQHENMQVSLILLHVWMRLLQIL